MRHSRFTIILIGLVASLIIVVARYDFICSYLYSPIVSGYDTNGHMELGEYYAQNIFPSVWGWAPEWFGGMPFPQFSPPLFYIVTAIASYIIPLSYDMVFRLLVVFLVLILPVGLVYVAASIVRTKAALWVTGITGALLVLTPFGRYDNLGVSFGSTFTVGLITHVFAYICLLLWLGLWLRSERSTIAYYFSPIFLAASVLSSVHVVPILGILFLSKFLVKEFAFFKSPVRALKSRWFKIRLINHYLIPIVLAVGLASFWLIPLFAFYSFMPNQSLGLTNGIGAVNIWQVITTWWPTALFFFVACIISVKKKDISLRILVFGCVLIALVIILPVDALLHRYPLHTYRLLPFLYFMGAIFAGWVFESIAYAKSTFIRQIIFACATGIFTVAFIMYGGVRYSGFYEAFDTEQARPVADFMKDKEGMYAVEAGGNARQLNYYINKNAGELLRSNYTVLVDPSLSALFHVPFRTNISDKNRELLSIYSLLNSSQLYLKEKNPHILAERSRALGISYLLVRSREMKKVLSQSSEFDLLKSFDVWNIYRLKKSSSYSSIVRYQPTLVVADLGIKGTVIDSISYVVLQEQAFIDNKLDLVLARANDLRLDVSPDLDMFQSLIVSKYVYDSKEKAKDRLIAYAKTNRLILVSSHDPLYQELEDVFKTTSNPHVLFVEYNLAPQDVSSKILNELDIRKIMINADAESGIKPLLIKSSYFPTWERNDGRPVYLATPAYMLTFASSSVGLHFATPPSVYIGWIMTYLTLGFLAILLYNDFHVRNK